MSYHSESHPLSKKIEENLRLPPNQFQIFLERTYDEQPIQTCSMISLMQFESRPKQQKQKLATSFNYLIERSFMRNDKNPDLWRVFMQNIAVKKGKSQKQQIALWRIHKITQKSLKKFVQSFEQQFTPIFQQIYYKLNFSTKILLQNIVIHSDIEGQSRLLLLKETFQQYIHIGIQLLFGLSALNPDQILQEMENRLTEYLFNLKECLLYLHLFSKNNNQEQYLVNKVCRNQQLFKLIYECVFLESFRDNVKIYPKQNQQGPSKYPLIFSQSGSFHLQQCYNNIKSLGLQIFCAVLNRYSPKSTMAQFDESKFLGMMENLIPCIINQIINTKTNKLSLGQNQKLTIAMLCCIRKSSEFLFMNNYMWGNYKKIFWNIIYPLLIVSDQQKRQYQDDPEGFIAQAETLVQKQFEQIDKVQSCKTYAGFLLESLIDNVDGAVTAIANQVIGLLDFCVNGVQNQISRNLKQVYKIKESYEGCITVLQVLSSKIKKRQQLLQKLRYVFIECRQKILKLKSLDKARTILYLCYNFDEIFRQSRPKQTPIIYSSATLQYYQYVAQCLQQNQNLTKCAIVFYETYCVLQPQAMIILDRIIQLIEITKQIDILTCMTKVLYELISTLDIDRLKSILERCLKRLFIDNQQYIRSVKHNAVFSNISMLKCLQSIKIIALYCKNIKNQSDAKDIMGMIWKVFDLFDFIDIANYGEDLIKIFDAVLSYLKIIEGPYFFQFLTNFAMYHQKQKEVGRLFYTYQALIIKGYQFLQSDPEGHNILNHIIQNLMIVVNKMQKRSIVAIVLIQYILNKFPKVKYNHQQIYERTLEILENQKVQKQNKQNKQLIASIYNLWIMGSSISEIYDLGRLDQLDLSTVYGYHARVFAVAMNAKIITLYYEIRDKQQVLEKNLQKILYLLRKNIEFLKIFTQKAKDINSKITTKIEQYSKQNPSQKLRQTFLFLKKNLREQDYNQIIKEIQTDITRQQLNGMLSKYVKESRVIFKFK